MVDNPPAGFPRITPYLLYEDLDATVDWLVAAFGFVDSFRAPGPDGRSVHAELKLGDAVVMMGCPGPDYRNPKHRGAVTAEVYVYVDDVDAHHATATAAGAEVVRELADQAYGDRTYAAVDPEGHRWSFAEHVEDVAPEDMHP